MSTALVRPVSARDRRVIEVRLMRARDMFEAPRGDVLSEEHSFVSGVDYCLGELRGHRTRGALRLEIQLPPEEIDDGVAERLTGALRRYCDQQIRRNGRDACALRLAGLSALRIGLPVCALGLVMAAVATRIRPEGGAAQVVIDHLGWVLAWLGLWFPLDEVLFYPLGHVRESRLLRLLRDAEVVVAPDRSAPG